MKATGKMEILYFNSRSILNKLVPLNSLLSSYSFDFFFITETWLKPFYNDSFIVDALHYNVLRRDRIDRKGGGVAVIFKKELADKICPVEKDFSSYNDFEIIAFDYFKNKNVFDRFVCVYLPPENAKNPTIVNGLLTVIKSLFCKCSFYVLGDFNFKDIIWSNTQVTAKRRSSRDFLSFLNCNNLTQLIFDSAHSLGGVLDLLFTSCPNRIGKLEIREPLTASNDHNMIEVTINGTFTKVKPIKRHNFFMADYPKITSFLTKVDWRNLLRTNNSVDDMYTKILNSINESISKYVPKKITKNKSKLPSHLRHILDQKKYYYKQSKLDSSKKETYKHYEKLYKKEALKHHQKLEQKIIYSKNNNSFYGYINKKLHSPSSIPPLKSKEGEIILNSVDRANLFNTCFTEVFISDNNITPRLLDSARFDVVTEMPDVVVTSSDVKRAISSLKNSVSRTPENIPAIFVKRTEDSLLYPLTVLFNHTIASGKVPNLWKEALIVPIHKKGRKDDPSNYRQLSMTSVFCRLQEKIIHGKISSHLSYNHILNEAQHGFIAKRSTLSQQIEMLDKLTENYDKRTQIDMIYLDFSKAFDRVSHAKLLYVLYSFKINTKIINWIKDYLSNRKQKTVVNNETSDFNHISSGVPQGSVLGPLFFVIFIDDLLKTLSKYCTLTVVYAFADDVKLLSQNDQDLQKSLNIVDSWAKRWQLTIQPKKSEHIMFKRGDQPTQHTFKINGDEIKKSNTVKDLGIYISNNLNWESYLQHTKFRAERVAHIILRTFKTHNLYIYTRAFKTYIRPLLEYNTSVWSPHKKEDTKFIESVQRFYTKRVCQRLNIRFQDYTNRLSIMKLNTLEYRRLEFDLILLYKILHKIIHINLSINKLQLNYNLRRHSSQLQHNSSSNTNLRRNFFSIRTIEVWNKLPEYIVSSPTLEIFKFKLRGFNLRSIFKFVF